MKWGSSTYMPNREHREKSALRSLILLVASLGPTLAVATPQAARPLPAVKILLEDPGVYRVGYEDLAATGLTDWRSPSSGLSLTCDGTAVPVWVEDGGDQVFGPGDWIEFLGEHLPGDTSYLNEFSRYRAYVLRFDTADPARMTSVDEAASQAGDFSDAAVFAVDGEAWPSYRSERHFEEDLLILRLPPAPEPEEVWFWAKLAHSHREPFTHVLDLSDLEPAPDRSVSLRIHLRGWSEPRFKSAPEVADHRLEVLLNGQPLAASEWSGTRPHLLEVPSIPADRLLQGDNALALKVPSRPEGRDGANLIDVVMLNWIEIAYPRSDRVTAGQAHFELTGAARAAAQGRIENEVTAEADTQASATAAFRPVRLVSDPGTTLRVYGRNGSRISPRRIEGRDAVVSLFVPPAGETRFVATRPQDMAAPVQIVIDRPSQLAEPTNRADYIIIAHHSLIEAIQPLAELHRQRGLDTVVVDVEDVYDEFNHGVLHPRAIRSFLAFAYEHWAPPAPRFVLLVGDASWDGKNAFASDTNYADWTYRPGEGQRFVKNSSTSYAKAAELNHRNLIPTWNYTAQQGHSASDNYFVAVAGDDFVPDMAIGRFAVVEPAEVAQIVTKTINYVSDPEQGQWQSNMLFITNESTGFQRRSDSVAAQFQEQGFSPHRIYPASSEISNEHHTRRLIEALDEGQLLVHFLGHGGRYIWRTGPPDLKKNHDLFTLDHLDELQPTDRLPVVLAMTCYSAPFDHPNADSIGEKFLRVGDRGAIAVMAASWRISPSAEMGRALIEELTRPDATIGEALMRTKHRIGRNRLFVETFNLFGDPAVALALPETKTEPASLPEAPADIARAEPTGQVGSPEP